MLSLKKAVAVARQAETCPIESQVRESKANGAVERAVTTWQGQFRTLKSHLESGIDMVLPREHPMLQ